MAFILLLAITTIAVCIWAIGAICGIAYLIEKDKKFKRPPLSVVPKEEDEAS